MLTQFLDILRLVFDHSAVMPIKAQSLERLLLALYVDTILELYVPNMKLTNGVYMLRVFVRVPRCGLSLYSLLLQV